MILIADSGSTKTQWIFSDNGKCTWQITTQGLNPYFTSSRMIRNILETELLPAMEPGSVSQLFFYGAGCSTVNNQKMIRDNFRLFFPDADMEIHHDILGAARALLGRKEGIACILGTGCNSCFYDGDEVYSIIPSLGYLFGDEGAGSYLGKRLLGSYLKDTLPAEIREAFDIRYGFTLEDILNSLYNKPFPHRFLASFSYFINDNIAHPYCRDLVSVAFTDFFNAHIVRYEHFHRLPVGFVGSVAFQYQEILKDVSTSFDVQISRILQSPMEGLVDFHT